MTVMTSTAKSTRHDWQRQEQLSLLELLEENTKTCRKLARLRRRFLNGEKEEGGAGHGVGLAAALFPLMEEAVDCFVQQCMHENDEKNGTTSRRQFLICGTPSMLLLERILQVYLACAQLDSVLAEELGRQGTHAQLVRLLRLSDKVVDLEAKFPQEEDLDAIIWIQDLAGEIAAMSATFPLKICPFSIETLHSRLPLSFTIASPILDDKISSDYFSSRQHYVENVLIHQVCTRRQSAQEDVGFGMCL
jgi:hypothetical protein